MKTKFLYLCVLALQISFTHIQAQARLVFAGDAFMVIRNNAVLVIDNPSTNAITTIAGNIISEGENNIIKWNIGTNTGTYRIPFTTTINATTPTNIKIPFAMRINGAGVGAGNIIFSTYGGLGWNNAIYPPSDVTNMNHAGVPNSQFVIDRFWRIDANGYTQKPTPDIRFGYADNEWSVANNTISESDLVAQYFDTGTNDWSTTFGTANTVSNTMSGVGITPSQFFKSWTLSSILSPLPLDLLNFTAKWQNSEKNIVSLQWNTANEINTNYFDVERSIDAVRFEKFATIPANRLSSTNSYQTVDANPFANPILYYRLKQVDNNGSYKYSKIISLQRDSKTKGIVSLYPNPATDIVNVSIQSNTKTTATIAIVDMLGRELGFFTQNLEVGINQFEINISHFAAGTYIAKIWTENSEIRTEKKFIKINR